MPATGVAAVTKELPLTRSYQQIYTFMVMKVKILRQQPVFDPKKKH